MKRKKKRLSLQGKNLLDWKCRACRNPNCVFSPACKDLPLPDKNLSVSPPLRKAFKMMRDYHHYAELRMSDITVVLGISNRRLEQLFKDELKCTFSECLRCLRAGHVERIRHKDSEIADKEIMHKVGFASPHGFYLARQALQKQLSKDFPNSFEI